MRYLKLLPLLFLLLSCQGSGLTKASAERTIQKAIEEQCEDFRPGAQKLKVSVVGIREQASFNVAIADLKFENLNLSYLPNYSGAGSAYFEKYNDGRWMLKGIRAGSGFKETDFFSKTIEVK